MTVRIPIRRGGKVIGHALVDDDFAYLNQWRWHTDRHGYPRRTTYIPVRKRGSVFIHRLVLGLNPGDGLMADHINHDILDNRRCNLRAVTNSQNQQNRKGAPSHSTSGLLGVCKGKNGRWRAYIGMRYLGHFANAEEAARVAAEARREAGYLGRTA